MNVKTETLISHIRSAGSKHEYVATSFRDGKEVTSVRLQPTAALPSPLDLVDIELYAKCFIAITWREIVRCKKEDLVSTVGAAIKIGERNYKIHLTLEEVDRYIDAVYLATRVIYKAGYSIHTASPEVSVNTKLARAALIAASVHAAR